MCNLEKIHWQTYQMLILFLMIYFMAVMSINITR